MKYTVYVTQTTKYAIEVEAGNPRTAESLSWDLMDDGEVSTQIDSEATAEYIVDENGVIYQYSHSSGWRAEQKR